MATIKAIKASSVHQIQSGQVIVDLGSVVKELVENSLDAGAASIEVRFKNNGLDSIEVQDNGKGISPDDYESVALKHHTSKLNDYDDLDTLQTFGFRGEALSSLCALSDFSVITAVAGAGAKGSKLEFDISGRLSGTSVVAAPQGTTVTVAKLFKNLPVRRKELEKNVKREYGKVLNLLQGYACISTNVKFSVYNTPAKGKKTLVFSTNANPSTRDNIANVHGAKTLSALVDLDLVFELQPSLTQAAKRLRSGSTEVESREVRIKGHISKPVFGEGRQAPDRQVFFVNSRPCALPQVAKAINEVYKGFNVSQSPFIFANLIMDTNSYDVNVSPDKRTIMLHDQADLLESLKASLTAMFDAQDHTVPTSQIGAKKLPAFRQPSLLRMETSRESDMDSRTLSPDPEDASPEASEPPAPSVPPRSPSRLIGDWAARDAETRHPTQDPSAKTKSPEYKLSLPEAWTRQDSGDTSFEGALSSKDVPNSTAALEAPDGSQDSIVEREPSSSPPPEQPRQVKDFNSRLLSQQLKSIVRPDRYTTETVKLADSQETVDHHSGDEEEAIAAIRRPTHVSSPGPVQNAFDRMRPKRTLDDVATVTVGDQTTIMKLGGPESKRRRIHTPKMDGNNGQDLRSSRFLSTIRSFAAPGTQLSADDDERAEDENDESQEEQEGTDEMDVDEHDEESDEGHDHHSCAHSSHGDESPTQHQSPDGGLFVSAEESDDDDEYLDEDEKKAREDARVAELIRAAEEAAAKPTDETLRRANQMLRSTPHRKDATLELVQTVSISPSAIRSLHRRPCPSPAKPTSPKVEAGTELDTTSAEAKLSLTISKSDFATMRIVGQFNLGFILAVRPSSSASEEDHLFIIDQHAADEKANFERLSATTTLTPQPLVTSKQLHLSAVEAELVLAHETSLLANGFRITATPTAQGRDVYHLLTLPTSKETTFALPDLEELLHLLSETPAAAGAIVRPSRVRRMLAMRACRASIMVGRPLGQARMARVVRGMGGMEKPWNCPHGRPTMRHLAGLGGWQTQAEGRVDWRGYMAQQQ